MVRNVSDCSGLFYLPLATARRRTALVDFSDSLGVGLQIVLNMTVKNFLQVKNSFRHGVRKAFYSVTSHALVTYERLSTEGFGVKTVSVIEGLSERSAPGLSLLKQPKG